MSDEHKTTDVELPHGAWLDPASGYVSFSIDHVTLSFSIDEFAAFSDEVADIAEILAQYVQTEQEICPTCGTHVETKHLTLPGDKDFN